MNEADSLLDALVADIRNYLQDAPQRRAAFDYLWQHQRRKEKVSAKELWDEVLEPLSESDKKRSERGTAENARQICRGLREDLAAYFTPERRWRWQRHIELPCGSRRVPYQLKVEELSDSPTVAFWRSHVNENNIPLVYAQPMFFLDIETGCHLRFLNTNPKMLDGAFEDLATQHPQELRKLYGSVEAARKRLRPSHVYIGMGDVAALDALATWFNRWQWLKVEKIAESRIGSLKGKSPVLLGSERTNRFIAGHLDAARCAYRLHDTDLFYVKVENPTEPEIHALSKLFPPPLRKEGNSIIAGSGMSLSVKRTRLALLTRMHNPESRGRTVTTITSDTTLAIQQVAHAITDDEQLAPILATLEWPDKPLPPSFEMLFSVEVAPSGIDDNAGPACLLAVRPGERR